MATIDKPTTITDTEGFTYGPIATGSPKPSDFFQAAGDSLDPRPLGVRERHIAEMRAAWLDAQSRERAYYALLAETDGVSDRGTALRMHEATEAAKVAYFAAMPTARRGVEL